MKRTICMVVCGGPEHGHIEQVDGHTHHVEVWTKRVVEIVHHYPICGVGGLHQRDGVDLHDGVDIYRG
ncbi:hypothetical protein DRO02_08550 [archaeon]|nr:MAG: hypothetical protein DRO02_08550 [archaeon]